MHHRRLDLEIAARNEEFAHGLDDLRARDKHAPRLRARDEIDVTLPVFLFLIGQPVKFFRQGAQRLRQQPQGGDLDRQLPGARLEDGSGGAEDIAEVPVLERVVRFRADGVVGDVQLDRAAHVLQCCEARLAHDALEQHAAGDRDHDMRGFELLVVLAVVCRVEVASEGIAAKVVRVGMATLAQRSEFAATLRNDLILVLRCGGRRIAGIAHAKFSVG